MRFEGAAEWLWSWKETKADPFRNPYSLLLTEKYFMQMLYFLGPHSLQYQMVHSLPAIQQNVIVCRPEDYGVHGSSPA
jgi:hypothetical protein